MFAFNQKTEKCSDNEYKCEKIRIRTVIFRVETIEL